MFYILLILLSYHGVPCIPKGEWQAVFVETIETIQPIIVRNFGNAHQADDDYKQALKDKSICRSRQCFVDELKEVSR